MSWYDGWGKRLVDVVLAGTALVVLSPLLLVTAVAIRLEDRGPVLFRQRRSGRDGAEFTLLKFRSMPVGSASVPSASAGSLRITRVGRVIRRTNIDELPQLLNILLGDMSVVGPRPALPSQEDLLTMRQENGALHCRPGLTGLAQVKSYDGMPVSEKAVLDGRYAARPSLFGDLGIILRTVAYLFRRPPVY
jgi:lipopolysaccharide/colanic/teichoic acid biosynthesis glycosyltransferase